MFDHCLEGTLTDSPNFLNLINRFTMLKSISPKILPLSKYERKISKYKGSIDEGVIHYIFETIKPVEKYCIEFGARDGINVHVIELINRHGFSALLLEGDEVNAGKLFDNYKNRPEISTSQAFITRENIQDLFRANNVPPNPFLLLIDIDGNDYHIWKAIVDYKPIVVCIEYNASYGPDEEFVIDYQKDFCWSGDDYCGASIKSLVDLGKEKGYELIHCSSGGDNLFFVLKEYFPLFGIVDNSIATMYQIPQFGKYGRAINGKGHPTSTRNSSGIQRFRNRLRYYLYSIPRKIVKRRMKIVHL